MPTGSGDDEFERAKERQFLRSVHAAASVAYERGAFWPPYEVYVLLARELRLRGIDPDPEAVYAAAHLISKGRLPPILRPGNGRRRREMPSTTRPDSSASERLGIPRQRTGGSHLSSATDPTTELTS